LQLPCHAEIKLQSLLDSSFLTNEIKQLQKWHATAFKFVDFHTKPLRVSYLSSAWAAKSPRVAVERQVRREARRASTPREHA